MKALVKDLKNQGNAKIRSPPEKVNLMQKRFSSLRDGKTEHWIFFQDLKMHSHKMADSIALLWNQHPIVLRFDWGPYQDIRFILIASLDTYVCYCGLNQSADKSKPIINDVRQ